MKLAAIVVAAAVVLIAAAAYALRAKPCVGAGCSPVTPGGCASTSDCASTSPYDMCVGGRCVPQACGGAAPPCPAGAVCTAGACVAAPQPSSCTTNAKCAAGFVCIEGVCSRPLAPATPCKAPGDCGSDAYYCDFGGVDYPTTPGTCAPAPAGAGAACAATDSAGTSAACPPGYVCAGGACAAPWMQPATCAADADCYGGYLCAGSIGLCVPPAALGAPCAGDEAGGRAGSCAAGACGAQHTCVQPGDAGGVCAADADCAAGLWCGAGVCGAAGAAADGATCYSDSACGAASWCSGAAVSQPWLAGRQAGVCGPLPGAGAACAPGGRCATGLACSGGFCYAAAPGGNGAACSAAAPCAPPYTCNARPGGAYACGVLSGQGGSCSTSYDCGEGDVQGVPMDCVGGVCMYPCVNSLDCDVGYACAPAPGGAGSYCTSAGPWSVASSSASTAMDGLSSINSVPATLRPCDGIGLGPCTFQNEAAAQAHLAAEGLGGYVLLSDAYADTIYLPHGTAIGMSSAALADSRPVSGRSTWGWAIVKR